MLTMARPSGEPYLITDDGRRYTMQLHLPNPNLIQISTYPTQDEAKNRPQMKEKCDADQTIDQGTEVDVAVKQKPYGPYDDAYITTYRYAHCGVTPTTAPPPPREYPLQRNDLSPGEENFVVGDKHSNYQPKPTYYRRVTNNNPAAPPIMATPRGGPFAATLRRYTNQPLRPDWMERHLSRFDTPNGLNPKRCRPSRSPPNQRKTPSLIDYEREDTAVRRYSTRQAGGKFTSAEIQALPEKCSKEMYTSMVADPERHTIGLPRSSIMSSKESPGLDHQVLLPLTLRTEYQTDGTFQNICTHDQVIPSKNIPQFDEASQNKLQCQILYLLQNIPLQPTKNVRERALRKKVLKRIYQKYKKMSQTQHRTKSEEVFMTNIRSHLSTVMRTVSSQRSLRARYCTRLKSINSTSKFTKKFKKMKPQCVKPNLEKIICDWFIGLNLTDSNVETVNVSFNSFVDRIRNISENLQKLRNEYKSCLKEEILDYLHEIPLVRSPSDEDYLHREANKLLTDILNFYNCSVESNSAKYIICFINNTNCTEKHCEEAIKKIIKCEIKDYLSEMNINHHLNEMDEVEQSLTNVILDSVESISSGTDDVVIDKIQSALLGTRIFSPSQSVKLSQMILKHVKENMNNLMQKTSSPLNTNFKPEACLVFQEANDRSMRKKWWRNNDDNRSSDNNSEIVKISCETKLMVGIIKDWLKECHFFISHKSRFKGAIKHLAEDIIFRQKYLALHDMNANTQHELEYLKFQIFKSLNFIFEQKHNDYASELMTRILNSETYKRIKANSIKSTVNEIINISNNDYLEERNNDVMDQVVGQPQVLKIDELSENNSVSNEKDAELSVSGKVINDSIQRISQAHCEKLNRLINESDKCESISERCKFKMSKSSIKYNTLVSGSCRSCGSYNELEVFQLCHLPQRSSFGRDDTKNVHIKVSSFQSGNAMKLRTPQQINNDLVKYLRHWCEEIPIDVRDKEEKSAAATARIVIQIGVGKQIVKIRTDPLAMQDKDLCGDILGEEVDDLLDCLPQSLELVNMREAAKAKLVHYVVQSNEQLLDTYLTCFSQERSNTVSEAEPVENSGPSFREKLNDVNFIDDYIKQNYTGDNKNIQLLYKKRLTEEIRRILREYRETGVQRNDEQLEQDIYKGLNGISIPTDDSYHKFAQQMLMKMEIDEWIKTLPIKQTLTPEDKHVLEKQIYLLAQKLSAMMENRADDIDTIIAQEISNFLSTLPLLCELTINREITISDLINRLKTNYCYSNQNNVIVTTDGANTDSVITKSNESSCLRKNNLSDRPKVKAQVSLKNSSIKESSTTECKKQSNSLIRASPITKYAEPEICYVTKECQSKISVKDHSQNTPRIAVPLLFQEDVRSMSPKDDKRLTSSDALLNYVMTWRYLASTPYQFAMLSIYLITKVSKLHQDPSMLSNDLLYEQVIDSFLEEALDRYGMEMDPLEKVGAISDIGKQLKIVRELVKTEYEVSSFKREIISTAFKIIHLHNVSKNKGVLTQIPEMSPAAENIADELVQMHFEAQDINQQCKRKLIDWIEAYVYEMKINNMMVFLCENLVKKAIMKAVIEIPAPSKDALDAEVKAIKLKQLIDVTFNDLPIASPVTSADKEHLAIMKCILTKRIQAINADVSTKSHEFYYKANTAIIKTLKHIPLRPGEESRALDYADQMFTRLFETRVPQYVRPMPSQTAQATYMNIPYRRPGLKAKTINEHDTEETESNKEDDDCDDDDGMVADGDERKVVPVFFGIPDSFDEYNKYPRKRFDSDCA